MIPTDLLATLDRLGVTVTVTAERALKVAAPKGALTPDLIQALRERKDELLSLLAWNEALADRFLHETLARLAGAYRPAWATRLIAESPAWAEAEARIEAAALVHDMPAFIKACRAYEEFALPSFAQWAGEQQTGSSDA